MKPLVINIQQLSKNKEPKIIYTMVVSDEGIAMQDFRMDELSKKQRTLLWKAIIEIFSVEFYEESERMLNEQLGLH